MDTSPAIRRTMTASQAPDRPTTESSRSLPSRPTNPTANRAGSALWWLPVVLTGATVATQISYPLLSGEALRVSTIATVVLFAAASLTHARTVLGPRAALRLLGVAAGIGLAAEALGVATGVPFGGYRYAGTLGPAVFDVPLVVPLAWTMMAYPCLLLGRRLARAVPAGAARRAATVGAAAWTLAAWDLFLDPQMVAAGHWSWQDPTPALPGVPGIPLTNYAGWLVVAAILAAALDRALPTPDRDVPQAVPAALLAWTWLGSALGNLAFFDRPAVAGYGLLAMGLTAVPYLRSVAGTGAGTPTGRGRR